jgi:pre-60S factor REI1
VYNLKRRISSLPTVSSDVFEAQVVSTSATSQEKEDYLFQETCEVCRKVYYSRQAYQGHLRTQHQERTVAGIEALSSSGSQVDTLDAEMNILSLKRSEGKSVETSLEGMGEEFIPSNCLFCPINSSNMLDNLLHMQKVHGLFIPDPEHLIDIESFIGYLFIIISDFQECLYCSITKSTVEGIQHHMRDKGHCKINFEEGSEWRLFYEYSDSESDAENPRNRVMASQAVGVGTASLDDELHLPSGKILGHRSQARHHRPNSQSSASSPALTAPSFVDSAVAFPTTTGNNEARTRQRLTIRNSDRLGMIGVAVQRQRALRAVEKMMLKRESRARDAYQAGVQKTANRQKFFKVRT